MDVIRLEGPCDVDEMTVSQQCGRAGL